MKSDTRWLRSVLLNWAFKNPPIGLDKVFREGKLYDTFSRLQWTRYFRLCWLAFATRCIKPSFIVFSWDWETGSCKKEDSAGCLAHVTYASELDLFVPALEAFSFDSACWWSFSTSISFIYSFRGAAPPQIFSIAGMFDLYRTQIALDSFVFTGTGYYYYAPAQRALSDDAV